MPDDRSHRPPRWADRFLEWYCAPEHLEDVQGALYEYFHERVEQGQFNKARRYYILDVLGHFRPHLLKRKRSQNSIYNLTMFNNYLKTSIRNLWKHKVTSFLNVLGLTLGLTSFLLIMVWVNHEKSFDGFHEKSDRIFRISNSFTSETEQFSQAPSGPALGAQLHKVFPEIINGLRFGTSSAQITVQDRSYFENDIGRVDSTFFSFFDFELMAGSKETALEGVNSMVITESTAIKYFATTDAIGKVVMMDGSVPLKVTGVMEDLPSNSQLQFDMLTTMELAKIDWNQPNMDDNWGGGWFHTYLLLAEGTDVEVLEGKINEFILPRLDFFTQRNMSYEYFLQPLASIHLNSDLRYDIGNNGSAKNVSIFSTVAIIVLLLACINYINLSTANAIKRAKEVGVKKMIGALRIQLISQYLVESILVMLVASVISTGLLYLSLPVFESFLGYPLILAIDKSALAVLLVGVLFLGLLAGVFPALAITSFKALRVIKGQLSTGRQGKLIRKSLVVFQFTATVALIIAIITVNRQVQFMQDQELGLRAEEVIHIDFRGINSVREKRGVLTDRLLENPAIKSVSFQRNAYPVGGLGNMTAEVKSGSGSTVFSSLYHMYTDSRFAETFGVEMVAGRFYSDQIATDTLNGVVINEAAVEAFEWGSAQDAIGREMGSAPNVRKVIGVVKDFNFEDLHSRVEPMRILPVRNNQYGMMAIRADLSDPGRLLEDLENIWIEINPQVPLEYSFMNEDILNQYASEFNFRLIFLVFSLLSVLIACLGLFGLAVASTNQRIKEIGVRKALGASTVGLVKLISRDFLLLILIATVIAAPVSWYGMEQWLDEFAYRIDFQWTFILLSGLLALAVSFLTIGYEAARAATRNPTVSLRYQ
ncbi:MAG: FtsX-like permease family protein [Roseivirga sp.]|nr:FtsX-like permease family protein [Roseivirga sp.]